MLPEAARYATLRNLPSGASLGGALVAAMNAIMADFAPLLFVAPQRHCSERNGAVFLSASPFSATGRLHRPD
jgi:hypothetical protein